MYSFPASGCIGSSDAATPDAVNEEDLPCPLGAIPDETVLLHEAAEVDPGFGDERIAAYAVRRSRERAARATVVQSDHHPAPASYAMQSRASTLRGPGCSRRISSTYHPCPARPRV